MIFKVIIQYLQTSKTSASQNNNQRQHQKTIRIFETEKISWGVGFSKMKTRDTDVILSPSFPQYLMLLFSEVWNYIPQADTLL